MKTFDENRGESSVAEILKLEYLDRCVKETLRLYPAISQILRYIDEDVQLSEILFNRLSKHQDSEINKAVLFE